MPAAPTVRLTAAQQELAVSHRRLSFFVLNKYFRRYARHPVLWDELQSCAVRGLIDAARRYSADYRSPSQPNRKILFITFAMTTIWGTVSRRVQKFQLQPVRFRTPIHSSSLPLASVLRDRTASPLDCAARNEVAELVRGFLAHLNPTDALVLRLRFGLDGEPQLINADIAAIVGVSREAIGQRVAKILRRLRKTDWQKFFTMCRAV